MGWKLLHDGGDARKIQLQLIVKSREMSDKELMNAQAKSCWMSMFALQTQRLTMTTCKFRFDSGLQVQEVSKSPDKSLFRP